MSGSSDEELSRGFLAAMRVGDLREGTVAEVTRHGVAVTLDGFAARPLGFVGSLNLSWAGSARASARVGERITARVIGVDLDQERVWLATTATESPELWAFLDSLRAGDLLSGRIVSIERFGVLVALDEGPSHPVLPGVGLIALPDLSWRRFEAATDVVRVGEHVTCAFLSFDTTNGEARLSLRATRPDPFQTFADNASVGDEMRGRVTGLVPFGVFVQVGDGTEGLIEDRNGTGTSGRAPGASVRIGDEIAVVITGIDRERRRLFLSRRPAPPASG
ncbi:S1 RNA-binding domain-containing protein [Streptomyces sp. NPDC088557]|uniref:S1 RNA-binding domain-containing protein n=1 Tax=Streptomyces sp. NPDC088557 TaxID=3365867 RepID=UPI0038109239